MTEAGRIGERRGSCEVRSKVDDCGCLAARSCGRVVGKVWAEVGGYPVGGEQ